MTFIMFFRISGQDFLKKLKKKRIVYYREYTIEQFVFLINFKILFLQYFVKINDRFVFGRTIVLVIACKY